MNLKEIKEMINLMNDNGLVELEIEKDDIRVRRKKAGSTTEIPSGPILIEKESILKKYSFEDAKGNIEKTDSSTIEIKAPMVGTFYRSPQPEAPPYAEVGQIIEPGQVICVIEAMKLMNEIKSEVKGKILEILVENTEPVEFGQPLFLIEPL